MVGGELGRMVSKRKKSAKKVQKPTEPIEEPVVEEAEPVFVDETPKLLQLLADAPAVPYISTIHDAVKFADKYRVWKLRVKAET